MQREWELVLFSVSGKEIPHWKGTRERCRVELRSLKAQGNGKLPNGVRSSIRKVEFV